MFLTVSDTAEQLAISPREVYNLVDKGRLQAYRLGPRLLRFHQEDIDRFIKSCRYIGTKTRKGGDFASSGKFTVSDSRLLNSFRRVGVEPKQTSLTVTKRADSTQSRPESSGMNR